MTFEIKDFSMEMFNNNVNNSGNVQTKYKEWTSYRQEINKFIIKLKDSTNNIIVLGAGECNDIDLHFLTNTFDEVTLSDVDTKSIDDGIKRQKLNTDKIQKIKKIGVEYTGLSKAGFFDILSKLATNKAPCIEIIDYINKTVETVKSTNILIEHKNNYDSILVCPTYTQLAYTQMEVLLKILYQYNIYPIDDLNKIITVMNNAMSTIIKNYNHLILSLIKDEGVVFMLTDIAEITDFSVAEKIEEKINDIQFINDFILEEGLDFGEIGRDDLKRKIKVTDESFIMWPFDYEKRYLVCCVCGLKMG